jgi:hypothetical protein
MAGLPLDFLFAGTIQGGGSRIDQVYKSILGIAGKFEAGHPFHGFRAPVGAHIAEYLGCTR